MCQVIKYLPNAYLQLSSGLHFPQVTQRQIFTVSHYHGPLLWAYILVVVQVMVMVVVVVLIHITVVDIFSYCASSAGRIKVMEAVMGMELVCIMVYNI